MLTKSDTLKLAEADPTIAAAFPIVAAAFAVQFPNCSLGVGSTYRSPSIQGMANTLGKSRFDGVNRFSTHQYFPSKGLDFIVRDPSEQVGWVMDGSDPRYAWAGAEFEKQGLEWGGRWQEPDWDHIQLPVQSPTAEQVAAGQDAFQEFMNSYA